MSDFFTPNGSTERLVTRILAGEAVFFIGAGFSLDSEGNSTDILIARLLARFEAIIQHLTREGMEAPASVAERLKNTFEGIFDIQEKSGTYVVWELIKPLLGEYYKINDWMINAYAILILELNKVPTALDRILGQINTSENIALNRYQTGEALQIIKLDALNQIDNACDRGKALFLDTLGFDYDKVMQGNPMINDIDTVLGSYRSLLPRHYVLAKLAREGFCQTLLTTNYDLLLEGAYRLSGFLPQDEEANASTEINKIDQIAATYNEFSRIASPTQFFRKGNAHRKALIVKIHGCAENYRREKIKGAEYLRSYLPAIVFTYREIQNWRNDSWSRDYFQTLLRTRTIIFSGYSAMDPVIHDTFRTVYEEIAAHHGHHSDPSGLETEGAPAFFMDIAGPKQFYGMETLRAASQAMGASNPDLIEHPNYLQFHLKKYKTFPNLDEQMRWLFHRTYRRRQAQILNTDLRRMAALLFKHPCNERQLSMIQESFKGLLESELSTKTSLKTESKRRFFETTVSWTEQFHSKLIREYVFAEANHCHTGAHRKTLAALRKTPWYYPMLDHPEWAGWSVVLELALRNMITVWQGKDQQNWVKIMNGQHPGVCFSKGPDNPAPMSMTFIFHPLDQVRSRIKVHQACKKSFTWFLSGIIGHGDNNNMPTNEEVWRWACGEQNRQDQGIGRWVDDKRNNARK